MRAFTTTVLALLAGSASAYFSDDEPSTTSTYVPACTATSSTGSGAFFDLRHDIAWPADSGKEHKSAIHKDYHARGYDYGKNFTMNICSSVVDRVTDVVGVDESRWSNVSAYYMSQGNIYSIGSESMDLKSRGRKLLLQYTGGSPCGESKKRLEARDDEPGPDGSVQAMEQDDEERSENPEYEYSDTDEDGVRRKSTIISFHCDRDPGNSQPLISFVGTDPDECAYFFEARSVHACASAEPHKPGNVGPGSVFGLILLIAVLVYFIGGIFFNRTVNHARGWRQLPNYSLWAGMWSFICDLFIRAISACFRKISRRRGYTSLRSGPSARDSDDEANRLIDQLDEEWDN